LVTKFGVSLLNVVATIESPASHHGTERPEAKNSEVFFDDLFPKKSAGAKQTATAMSAIIQSSAVSRIELILSVQILEINRRERG